ncbi:MAG: sigma-70 family RNA polymerase sigma factor [Vicinamibacterales bacterium]
MAESASNVGSGADRVPPAMDAATLWADFGPPLRRFLARRVPPGIEADDLLQEVFVRVVRNLGSLRGTDRPEAWLFQIARNALRDALRVRVRRDERTDALEVDPPDERDTAGERAAASELAPCLTGMIRRLEEPYRTAITLTSLQGVTQAEAARQAGISISGMKSRVQRGREQLRQMLVICCAVSLDVRGGVSDFRPREPGSCVGPSVDATPRGRTGGRCC